MVQNHNLSELQQKTKEELIEIILEFQEMQKMANTDVHVINTLDKLREYPSLEAHINKVYNNSKNVSVLMFRIYNLDKSDFIFNSPVSRKILNDVTKILKSHMRSMDILIKYNEQNDSVNSVINRLNQALLELEKDSVHHIIHV